MTAELLQIVVLACQIHGANSPSWIIQKDQIKCQQRVLMCVKDRTQTWDSVASCLAKGVEA